MTIPVKRYKMRKIMSDKKSPQLYYLKQEPGSSKTFSIEKLAEDIETIGSLSTDDVIHVMRAFMRRLRSTLTEGNKVKIDGLGTFYITFNTRGVEEAKDCTVKNIRRVNVRFAVDNRLRLVNDSTATTRGGENNVQFYIKNGETTENPSGEPSPEEGGFIDPTE